MFSAVYKNIKINCFLSTQYSDYLVYFDHMYKHTQRFTFVECVLLQNKIRKNMNILIEAGFTRDRKG